MGAAILTPAAAAVELLERRQARRNLLSYVCYTKPDYKLSPFAVMVCDALDQFVNDVLAGVRPILMLTAPPQHGKTELVSRKFPSYLLGRFPEWRVGGCSYSDDWAHSIAQDVRRNIADDPHVALFPPLTTDRERKRSRFNLNRVGEFNVPNGSGSYLGRGIGAGLTGRPLTIGIIDDPTKNEKEALSPTVKEGHWNWYQSVFLSRFSEFSGQIIMATPWAEDDLPGRIAAHFKGNPRFKLLRFPAINDPGETGYNPELPPGALVPELHSLQKLQETKSALSDYWWSALYQQSPLSLGGNVFKSDGIRYYLPKDLPAKFDKLIASWDCTFKDTDGTDYVVGQVWGKRGADCYLLDQTRDRMSFTATVKAIETLDARWPNTFEILIEDKANGPAVIDTLKSTVPRLVPIEPDGSKLARAHAVTSYWEAGNVHIPHPDVAPWVKAYVAELQHFPNGANDDQVDATTQALRRLYPLFTGLNISQDALKLAARR